ncbi:hypothetical protein R3P38DRAFT_3204125 [Favolaschia claudopus]|uniref:Uncharacterized protein n=1 Tax=Favolaschia claudopus TaxID=2862362 RepID=A0AAW0AU53_9AGAR
MRAKCDYVICPHRHWADNTQLIRTSASGTCPESLHQASPKTNEFFTPHQQFNMQAEANNHGQSPPSQQQYTDAPTLTDLRQTDLHSRHTLSSGGQHDECLKWLESCLLVLGETMSALDKVNRHCQEVEHHWNECKMLVDQLRVENAALRATLHRAQTPLAGAPVVCFDVNR